MRGRWVQNGGLSKFNWTAIILAVIIAVTVYSLVNLIQWYYYDSFETFYSKYPAPYLLEKLLTEGNVKVRGSCNLDEAKINLYLNLVNESLERVTLNGVNIGQLKCEYFIEAGKK